MIIQVLVVFITLITVGSCLTDIMVYFPLNLLQLLQWLFGYIPLALGAIVLIWFFGD